MKQTANTYAGMVSHYIFRYQTVFAARFDKKDEDDQVKNEIEFYNNLNINQNLQSLLLIKLIISLK